MAEKLERKSHEELVDGLLRGEIDVNELNVLKTRQREAFVTAIEKRPALLAKIRPENSQHLLKHALTKNPLLFIHITKAQYTDEFAQMFLYERMTGELRVNKRRTESKTDSKAVVQKSFDEKVVLVQAYATPDGEDLCYFDKELQLPLAIKVSAKVSLKIVDAIKFIEKLDTHITQLGEIKIKTAMFDLISSQFTAYLTEYISKKQVGYYTLCAAIRDVEDGFVAETKKAFGAYGIEVSEFIVKQFAIPKDVQNKIESLAFEIRQRREGVQADAEFARISLENYEAKLAIESKYPNAESSLTEYEKDLALKRYMTRLGLAEKKNVDLSVAVTSTGVDGDEALEKPADIVPEIEPKENTFRTGFITLAVLCGIASVIAIGVETSVGLIMAGAFAGLFGLVAACCTDKLKKPKAEPNTLPKENSTNHPEE